MSDFTKFYINGKWVEPIESRPFDVINPATEEPFARISLGSARPTSTRPSPPPRRRSPAILADPREERLALLRKIVEVYQTRYDEMAETITKEMGAPAWLSKPRPGRDGHGASQPMHRPC